jgi:hypothetical protein
MYDVCEGGDYLTDDNPINNQVPSCHAPEFPAGQLPDPDPTVTPTETPPPDDDDDDNGTDDNGGGGHHHGRRRGASQSSPTPAAETQGRSFTSSTLVTDKDRVGYDKTFTLAGMIETGPGCSIPTTVEILKRAYGTDSLQAVGTAPVAADGSWSFETSAKTNASYATRTSDTEACSGATSSPVEVLVRAGLDDVDALLGSGCDGTVSGRVLPDHDGGRVKLLIKTRQGWRKLGVDRLDEGSSYGFKVRRCGSYKVVFPEQDERNIAAAKRFRLV